MQIRWWQVWRWTVEELTTSEPLVLSTWRWHFTSWWTEVVRGLSQSSPIVLDSYYTLGTASGPRGPSSWHDPGWPLCHWFIPFCFAQWLFPSVLRNIIPHRDIWKWFKVLAVERVLSSGRWWLPVWRALSCGDAASVPQSLFHSEAPNEKRCLAASAARGVNVYHTVAGGTDKTHTRICWSSVYQCFVRDFQINFFPLSLSHIEYLCMCSNLIFMLFFSNPVSLEMTFMTTNIASANVSKEIKISSLGLRFFIKAMRKLIKAFSKCQKCWHWVNWVKCSTGNVSPLENNLAVHIVHVSYRRQGTISIRMPVLQLQI